MNARPVSARLFDATRCALGEGPLWHPERNALFWFDILGQRMLMRSAAQFRQWRFTEMASAAGWVDADTLLMATETALVRFDLETGDAVPLATLEADRPDTRSNDGRADPWGGFWIGTMGKNAEPGAGAIYRFWRGHVHRLFDAIAIPNAIAFAPDRSFATFTDSARGIVQRVALDRQTGMPVSDAIPFIDLTGQGAAPDGAVFDAEGCLWLAEWGAGRVARYNPDGILVQSVAVPARHTSCPAFGGDDFTTLYCTTAEQGLDLGSPENAQAGQTFCARVSVRGLPEPKVTLSP